MKKIRRKHNLPPKLYDVLVIGSGAAGLTLALKLAPHAKIAVLSKSKLHAGATFHAQGGVATVLDSHDSIENHIQDTLRAGAGLCHPNTVQFVIEQSQTAIQWLIQLGVPFTQKNNQQYHLTKEGGHSHRRILHVADATGKAIHQTLLQHAKKCHQIHLYEHHFAIDLITSHKLHLPNNSCWGAYVLDCKKEIVHRFLAKFVVLATGGASKAYLYTSNWDQATGDGIAMAWRAGCPVANMEFIQFHPTCLYHPYAKSFLISEAVRGEGGKLRLPNGAPFMHKFHPQEELAPRDIVARAIDHEMKRLGLDHVYLDISHKPKSFLQSHFPNIYQKCLEFGIDISQQPIPIVPAAHYTCGGVAVNQQGQTPLKRLYAIGETSFTGLHGANRLASNSLLECLVYAHTAANDILKQLHQTTTFPTVPPWDESQVRESDEDVVINHNWHELRQTMWNYVGIVRTTKRLKRAQNRIQLLKNEIHEFYHHYKISPDLLELRNLITVAELIVESALQRKESRGLHYTLDYPHTLPQPKDTILTPQPKSNISPNLP
ncbi:MAG: L-aspartate oxidase [Planctomycetota bacterium]|nr:MAG: L-aspartate oxidase [Planctomycetota bacterium]